MSARGKRPGMNGLVIFRYLKEASRPECFLSFLLAFHQENGCARQSFGCLICKKPKHLEPLGEGTAGRKRERVFRTVNLKGSPGASDVWRCCWPEIGFSAVASSPVAHDLQAEDLREFSDVCLFHYTLGWSEGDLQAYVSHHLPRFGFSIANWKIEVLTVPGDFHCLLVLVVLGNTLSLILSTVHRMRPPPSRERFTGSQS